MPKPINNPPTPPMDQLAVETPLPDVLAPREELTGEVDATAEWHLAPPTPPPKVMPDAPAAPGRERERRGVPFATRFGSAGKVPLAVVEGIPPFPSALPSAPLEGETGELVEDLDIEDLPASSAPVLDQADGLGDRASPLAPPPPVPAVTHSSSSPAITPPVVVPPRSAVAPHAESGAARGTVIAPVLPPGAAWPEALSDRPRKKRLKPWFEEVFDEDYLRTLPFMTAEQTLREVGFIKDALAPPVGGQLLDVGCGYGRHAIELGQQGLRVTGIDLSLPLLIRAADESQRRSLAVNFVHADMREMAFDSQFDGAYCMLTSFGYFDEETNLKVATSICRALKPGGRFLIDTINRDYLAADLPTRVWWEGDGCVVLEEVDFNFHTSRVSVRRSVVFQDGRQVEQDISIRAYSLHELGKLLRLAGFRVIEVSGSLATRSRFFGATSRNILMICERTPA